MAGVFLAQNLLASLPMPFEPPIPDEIFTLGSAVSSAIARRYPETEGLRYGITRDRFAQIVNAVMVRYAGNSSETEQLELVAVLHVEELILARACSVGCEGAWETFLTRFRVPLYETAYRLAKDEASGRELADGLYAELYGIPNDKGVRISKLDYYMGRGSLEGWLRSVLSRQYMDHYRAQSKDVSLEEQVEAGVSFRASPATEEAADDARVAAAVAQTITELNAEERFLLSSYYLDQSTLAEIGRQLRVHESTISRKLERLMVELRKRVRKRWLESGISTRRCDELLQELDVRDLNVDVAANIRQETVPSAFYKKDGSVT